MKPLTAAWAGALAVLCLEAFHSVADAWMFHHSNLFSLDKNGEPIFSPQMPLLEFLWSDDFTAIRPSKLEDGYEFSFDLNPGPSFNIKRDTHSHCAAGNLSFNLERSSEIEEKTGVASLDDCQQECHSDSECIAAQYQPEDETCRLFSKVGGVVEGVHTAIVLPTCNPACFMERQKFDGPPYASLGFAPNALVCQALCRSDEECHGFSWSKQSQQCTLFRDGATLTEEDYHVSGRREICAGLLPPDAAGSPMLLNSSSSTDRFKAYRSIKTAEECRIECLHVKKCLSYDFDSNKRICYLNAARGTPAVYPGTATGPRFSDASCYGQGYLLVSSTPGESMNVKHPAECHTECYKDEHCLKWTYHPETKLCTLIPNVKDIKIQTQLLDGAYWGSNYPCNNDAAFHMPNPECGQRGIKYGDTPFKTVPAGDPPSCQAKCAATLNCEAYVYDSRAMECHFHSAAAVRFQERDDKFFSGPKVCKGCQSTDKYYSGEQAGEIDDVESAEECQLNCQATEDCAFWSYTVDSKECTFYKEGAVERSGKRNITGPKFCDGGCDLRSFQAKTPPFGFSEVIGKTTLQECRDACRKNEKCVTFTHGPDSACTLSDATNLRSLAPHSDPSSVVGFRQCAACIRQGLGYRVTEEALLWEITANNGQECQERCELMEECTFFSFNIMSKKCSLLSGKTDEESGDLLISGPARCAPDTSCVIRDVGLTAADTLSADVEKSLAACQEKCKEDVECKFFTYESATKRCTLKSGGERWRDDLRTKQQTGFITGTKKCMANGDDISVCETHNFSPYGKPLDGATEAAEGPKDCRRKCLKEPRCRFWIFDQAKKQCEKRALDGPGSQKPFVPDENLLAGSRLGCPRCLIEGVTYEGEHLSVVQTDSEATCAQGCEGIEKCVAFSFAKDACTLFKEVDGMQPASPDTVSGPKKC